MSGKVYGSFYNNVVELTRLAAAQIRVAINESGESVDDLTQAFTDIVEQDRSIRDKVNNLSEMSELTDIADINRQISSLSAAIGVNVQNAIIAFQFYDRLCQRLDHTSECLRRLSEIEDTECKASTNEVALLRDRVYNHFSMEEERQLFDAVLASADFESAIANYKIVRANSPKDDEDDIELF